MKKVITIFIILLTISVLEASAKFVQEVELKDGTVLVGYVYRQQPNKILVFHSNYSKKDIKAKYRQRDKNYTLQWKDVKSIRRSAESEALWCNDKITLANGTTLVGQIEEQMPGKSFTIRLNGSGTKKTVSINDVKTIEKEDKGIDSDLWIDRQYTNQLRLTDKTIHEGLIVLQYRGEKLSDCYLELLHANGYKERIYLLDIEEYIIQIK